MSSNSNSDDCPMDLRQWPLVKEKLQRGYTFDLPKYDTRYNECIYIARDGNNNINQIESEPHFSWRKNEQSSTTKPSMGTPIFLTIFSVIFFASAGWFLYDFSYKIIGVILLLICALLIYFTVTEWINYTNNAKKFNDYDKWIHSEPTLYQSYIKSSN